MLLAEIQRQGSAMKTNSPNDSKNTVYISNLSYERDRNGLKSLFSKFGRILYIKIIVEPSTNQSRGMAFVEMSSATEAKKAIDELNGTNVDGRTVKVRYATPLRENSSSRTRTVNTPVQKEKQKDLEYTSIQLAKKARNDAKRNSNPFAFKIKSK